MFRMSLEIFRSSAKSLNIYFWDEPKKYLHHSVVFGEMHPFEPFKSEKIGKYELALKYSYILHALVDGLFFICHKKDTRKLLF